MSAISTAIGLERKSRVSGYKIRKGFFDNNTPNLPQIVALFGEANTANQIGLDTDPYEFTTARQVANRYGYGSPLHQMARILRPVNSSGIGGIPTVVFPQSSDSNAAPTIREWTITGSATANTTHRVVVNGRDTIDFLGYDYSVIKGDTATSIAKKIADAINSVLGAPVIASATDEVVSVTTKWKGDTSTSLKLRFNVQGKPAGISYSQTGTSDGAGSINLAEAFSMFGDTWYTSIINPYGTDTLEEFEDFNGVADSENPTGRYQGTVFKPFMAFFGQTLDNKDEIVAISDAPARRDQLTNVMCNAPRSEAFPWEVATNYVLVFARIMQDTPELDVNSKALPDLPIPINHQMGDMSLYNNRDFMVKKGASTVLLENGNYSIQDLVTTYHPEGETPLQYAYPRNLNLDWNVSFAYRILETIFVKDRVLIQNDQITDSTRAIKPKEWRATVYDLFDTLALRALLKDPEFSKASLRTEVNTNNPDRLDTFFRYRRTGIARIESTDVAAGF